MVTWLRAVVAMVDRRDLLAVAGVGSIVYGVGQWSPPAGWITFGAWALGLWALPYLRRRED